MDKKALKEAGKNWIDKTVESAKRINKSLLDPLGVKDFVSDYKKSKRKGKRTKSRMAQRTGNKYMIDKGTTYVQPKPKLAQVKKQKAKPDIKPKPKPKPDRKAKGGMVIAPKSGSAHYTSKKNSKSIAKKYFKGSF